MRNLNFRKEHAHTSFFIIWLFTLNIFYISNSFAIENIIYSPGQEVSHGLKIETIANELKNATTKVGTKDDTDHLYFDIRDNKTNSIYRVILKKDFDKTTLTDEDAESNSYERLRKSIESIVTMSPKGTPPTFSVWNFTSVNPISNEKRFGGYPVSLTWCPAKGISKEPLPTGSCITVNHTYCSSLIKDVIKDDGKFRDFTNAAIEKNKSELKEKISTCKDIHKNIINRNFKSIDYACDSMNKEYSLEVNCPKTIKDMEGPGALTNYDRYPKNRTQQLVFQIRACMELLHIVPSPYKSSDSTTKQEVNPCMTSGNEALADYQEILKSYCKIPGKCTGSSSTSTKPQASPRTTH